MGTLLQNRSKINKKSSHVLKKNSKLLTGGATTPPRETTRHRLTVPIMLLRERAACTHAPGHGAAILPAEKGGD
jgi:hypothetical protein